MPDASIHPITDQAAVAGEVDTVVLDLDGTLVDSVYEHVRAWKLAFQRVGLSMEATLIHRAIGMGGDRLVAAVGGDRVERAMGDEVRAWHDEFFNRWIGDIRPFPGSPELIEALVESGRRVVVASSSPPDQVDRMLELVEGAHLLTAVVTGRDVDASKPSPDLVELALERAMAGTGALVGDAVWDVEAARRAGIACIGLRSGGISEAELTQAGAVAVYDGPRDLALHVDRVFGRQPVTRWS